MNEYCLTFANPIRDAISRIRFASSSNNLLISSWDWILRLYDVDACQLRLEAPTDGAALLDCCFESMFSALSADSDGAVLRYDLYTGKKNAVGNHDDAATCVEYSEETCQIISAGWDKKLNFWDARSATSSSSITLPVLAESVSLSGFNLVIGLKTSVRLYDLRYLDESIRQKEHTIGTRIKCVRSSSDFGGFAVGSVDGRVSVQYLDASISNNEGYAFRCHPANRNGRRHLASVNDIAFDPSNDGVFVTGDNDGYVIVWDTKNRKRVKELPRRDNGNSVASLAYNHSGKLLAVAESYTYHDADDEREELLPVIMLHQMSS